MPMPWERDWSGAPAAQPKPWERNWSAAPVEQAPPPVAATPDSGMDAARVFDNLTRWPRAAIAGVDRAGRAMGGLALKGADIVLSPLAELVGDTAGYEAARGDFERAFDPKRPTLVPLGVGGQPTWADELVSGLSQAVTGYAAGAGAIAPVRSSLGVAAPLVAGGLGDAVAFPGTEPNVSSLVEKETGVPMVTAIRPGDSELVGRLKNVGEGQVLGMAFDGLLRGAGALYSKLRGAGVANPTAADVGRMADAGDADARAFLDDPDVRAVAEATGITDPADPRLAALQDRLAVRRQAEAARTVLPVTDADVAAREAAAAQAAPAQATAVRQAPNGLTADQLGAAIERGEQPAPPRAPDTVTVAPPVRMGGGAEPAPVAATGPVDLGTQEAIARARGEKIGERIGEDPAGLVEAQLGVPRATYDSLPTDAKERVVAAAQRQRDAEAPNPQPLRTSDAAQSQPEGGQYSPATPPQIGAGEAGRRVQPTAAELDRTGAQRPYSRTATGASDRPFRADSTDGTTPEQLQGFERQADETTKAARAANEEDLLRRWREQQGGRTFTDEETTTRNKARDQYSGNRAKGTFSNKVAELGTDSRFATDDYGFVKSDKGGPVKYGTQVQAAKWILNVGHKRSPDQVFEIENHPSGQGFTVRERGRNAGPEKPEAAAVNEGRALPGPDWKPKSGSKYEVEKIDQVIETAQSAGRNARNPHFTVVGEVTPGRANEIKARINEDVSGFHHVVDEDFVTKALRDHGDAEAEAARGQVAVTESDIRRIPDVIERGEVVDPKEVNWQGKGKPGVIYRLQDGATTYYVEEVRRGRKVLAAKTMWKKEEAATRAPSRDAQPAQAETGARRPSEEQPAPGPSGNSPPEGNVGAATPQGKGTKLYANPLDPEALGEAFGPMVRGAARLVRNEIDNIRKGTVELRRAMERDSSKGAKGLRQSLADAGRLIVYSNRGVLKTMAKRYEGSTAIREVMDHLATDPGAGRAIGKTFEEAVERHGKVQLGRLANILGDLARDTKALDEIRDMLTGVRSMRGPYAETAQKLRTLLDDEFKHNADAGVDLGYVRGDYFPRVFDDAAILSNSGGFQKAAARLFREEMGMSAGDADTAALEWFKGIQQATLVDLRGATPASSYTKGRALPAAADSYLKEYLVTDPVDALTSYLLRSAKRAEYVRRFGNSSEKLADLFKRMADDGVSKPDQSIIAQVVRSSLGQMTSTLPSPIVGATSWVQTAGTIALLPRAVLTSLAEPMAAGVRSGSVMRGLEAFVETGKALLKTGTAEEKRAMAQALGIVGDAMSDMLMANRFGGAMQSRSANHITARFFQRTGLHAWTEATRVASMTIGQGFVRHLAGEASNPASRMLLRELGIPENKVDDFAKWVLKHDDEIGVTDLKGDNGELYGNAMARFVDESIMDPKAVDRPVIANHPVGRMMYGLMSYLYAFNRNVVFRTGKQIATAAKGVDSVTGQKLAAADRMAMAAAPTAALMAMTAVATIFSEGRERIFNPSFHSERTTAQKLALGLSRSGLLGPLDPVLNGAFAGLKYQRDLSNFLIGAGPAFFAQNLQRILGLFANNSPNTNTAEWNAVRGAYDAFAMPALIALLSVVPGGTPVSALAGAGIQAVSVPELRNKMTDAVVGEKDGRKASGPAAAKGKPLVGSAPTKGR